MSDLTPRQQQVAELVARGMSNKAIARELGVSVRTVEDHLAEAASRLPFDGKPRYKCMLWFFNLTENEEAA